jgi:hypothetical protein
MTVQWTQSLTEVSTWNLPGGRRGGLLAHIADNLTAITESIVCEMWKPRRLTNLMGSHGLLLLVRPEGLGKLKRFIHLIGSRTHGLPVCSIVPQALRCWYELHWMTILRISFYSGADSSLFEKSDKKPEVCHFEGENSLMVLIQHTYAFWSSQIGMKMDLFFKINNIRYILFVLYIELR